MTMMTMKKKVMGMGMEIVTAIELICVFFGGFGFGFVVFFVFFQDFRLRDDQNLLCRNR